MNPLIFRIYWSQEGGHITARWFSGFPGQAFAGLGSLTMDEHDWHTFEVMLQSIPGIVFISEPNASSRAAANTKGDVNV